MQVSFFFPDTGFDPNSMLSSGWTALMHASDLANVEITVLLLDHGANPRTKKGDVTVGRGGGGGGGGGGT